MKKFMTILILTVICVICAIGFTACKDSATIKSVVINENGDLIITYTDDSIINAGKVVDNENPNGLDFYLKNDGTYEVYVGKAKLLGSIEIPSTYKGKAVSSIGYEAFYSCTRLENLTIPNSITNIENRAFHGCYSLTNITFGGTVSQWEAISKGINWKSYISSSCMVHCSDGDINI